MARVYTEGFEWGGPIDPYLLPLWDVVPGVVIPDNWSHNVMWPRASINAEAPSGGSVYSYRMDSAGNYNWSTEWQFPAVSEMYLHWDGLITTSNHTNTYAHYQVLNSTGAVIWSAYRSGYAGNRTLTAYKGDAASQAATTTIGDSWHTFDLRIKNTTGSYLVEFRVDGGIVQSYSDSTPIGSNVRYFYGFAFAPSGNQSYHRFDNMAFNDTTGGVDNSWPGWIQIAPLVPNGNGDLSQWTGSDGNSTDNYLLVDERPMNGDTDYVATATDGNIDLYNVTSPTLGTGETVKRVWVMTAARKTEASAKSVQTGLKSGSTTAWGTAVPYLSSAWRSVWPGDMYTVNPDTGTAWDQASLDALQIGIKLGTRTT